MAEPKADISNLSITFRLSPDDLIQAHTGATVGPVAYLVLGHRTVTVCADKADWPALYGRIGQALTEAGLPVSAPPPAPTVDPDELRDEVYNTVYRMLPAQRQDTEQVTDLITQAVLKFIGGPS